MTPDDKSRIAQDEALLDALYKQVDDSHENVQIANDRRKIAHDNLDASYQKVKAAFNYWDNAKALYDAMCIEEEYDTSDPTQYDPEYAEGIIELNKKTSDRKDDAKTAVLASYYEYRQLRHALEARTSEYARAIEDLSYAKEALTDFLRRHYGRK